MTTEQKMKQKTNKPLSSFSIIVIFVLVSIIGIGLLPRLNVSLVPSRTLPSVTVNYNWHNASARIIESSMTSKLEGLFSGMKGVQKIESKTTKSRGTITVYFDEDINMDAARFQISSYIRQAYADFPDEASYPVISVNTPDDEKQNLLTYAIYSSASAHYIQKYAQNYIKPKISRIKGIHKVQVYGATPYEWFISYDPEKLRTLNINPNDITKAVRKHFSTENIGYANVQKDENASHTRLRVVTQHKNKATWEDISIEKSGSRIVYLDDIAEVNYKKQKPSSYHRINGLNTINMVISPEKRVNTLKLARKVKANIHQIKKDLPSGYSMRKMYDATNYINKELKKVGVRTIIAVIVLLTFVFLISRRLKYLILITVSLIANLAIAVIFYYVTNLEIHIYSLAGMTISLGIIIDNSIIMADHIRHQHNRRGFLPVFAATLTTIGALSLVFFLNKTQQLKLIDFSLIIIINLGVSLFIALFFIPSLLEKIDIQPKTNARLIRRKRRVIHFTRLYEKWIQLQLKYKWAFIVILILAFGTPIYQLPSKIEKDTKAAGIYNKTLGSEWYQENIANWANKYFGGTLRLFTEFVYESSFYSKPGRTKLFVSGEMPEGATIQQINAAVKKMENYLSRFDEIDLYTTRIQSYRNARITIYFKDQYEKGYFPFKLKGKIIAKANSLGGMDWSIYGVGKGFSNAVNMDHKNSRIYVYGYNYEQLYQYAEKLKSNLNQNQRVKDLVIRGESSWRSPPLRHKIVVDLKEAYMAQLNVSATGVYSALKRRSMQPTSIGKLFINDQLRTVNITSEVSDFDRWKLKNAPLDDKGRVIKLKQISEIKKVPTGNDIYKKDQEYQLAVAFNFAGPGPLRKKVITKHIDKINNFLPLGYHAQRPQFYFFRGEETNKLWMLSLIILIVFFICSVLFESLKKPFVILSLIPISFIGVFLTFYFFNINFDQGGYASFILLAGITVNSSLYIINEYNNQPHSKSNVINYLKAFNHKIIPILLTISSTILGLVPFLIGGQNEAFWFAFAAGSIGGLIFSLIGVFIFLPVFFLKKNTLNNINPRP
jgi:multidrug efflux pump subunit AcrB